MIWRLLEKNLLYFTVGNILQRIEVLIVSWYFDAALPACRTVEILSARIVKHATVYRKVVVVEAFFQRT